MFNFRGVTARQFDDALNEANEVVELHNKNHSDYPLRSIRRDSGVFELLSDRQYRKVDPNDNSVAITIKEDDKVYVRRSKIRAEAKLLNQLRPVGWESEAFRIRMALLDILMHENVHRSCKRKPLSQEAGNAYYTAMLVGAEGTVNEKQVLELQQREVDVFAEGLSVEFVLPEGILHFGEYGNEANEFLTEWVSVQSLSTYLAGRQIITDARQAQIALLSMRLSLDCPAGMAAFKTLVDNSGSEEYNQFYQDYFEGDLPERFIRKDSKYYNKKQFDCMVAGLVGPVSTLPAVLEHRGMLPKTEESSC